ncbi:MAG TPA: hypothetical protein VF789_09490 [Thermoanaerobaculia bacterium]
MTRKFFLGCSLLALLAAGFIAYRFFYRTPPIRVEPRDYGAHVDLHFLGEYCIGVSDLQLVDTTSGKTVWRVHEPKNTEICEFDLRAGDNDVPPSPTFQLHRGVSYDLIVTGNNGTGRYTTGRVRLQL